MDEMKLSPEQEAAAAELLAQLHALNAAERDAYATIVEDYQAIYAQELEHQVRVTQLDKEAGELREENTSLHEEVEALRTSAADGAKAEAAEAKAAELQSELGQAYKSKSQLSEDLLKANAQLAVVRESHERTGREVEACQGRIETLRGRVAELEREVDKAWQAHAVVDSEMEGRLTDKEAAEAEAARLRTEVGQLAQRLVELKATEAERMDEVNMMCEQMINNAKQWERTAAAQAAAAGSRLALAAGAGARGFMNMVQSGRRASRGSADGGRRSGDGDAAEPSEAPIVSALQAVLPTRLEKTVAGHAGGAFGLAWERSGGRLASAGADNTVKLWDSGGHHLITLQGMLEGVLDVAWTCDGNTVLGAGNDKSIRVWDPHSGRARHTMTGHGGKVTVVEASPMEASKAFSSGTDRCLKVWDLNRGYNVGSFLTASSCNALMVTLDGGLIVSGHFDGGLRLWDARSGKRAHEVAGLHDPKAGGVCAVAAGALGDCVLTAGKDNTLRLVDLRTLRPRLTLRSPGYAVGGVWTGAALGPDEKHAAAGSFDGTVFVWELSKGAVVGTLRGAGSSPVLGAAWSPQGIPLATCDNAGAISLWAGPEDAAAGGNMEIALRSS